MQRNLPLLRRSDRISASACNRSTADAATSLTTFCDATLTAMEDLGLLLVFEFKGGEPTFQASFKDMRGIHIPMIGDSVCPGKGSFKVVSRTFSYDDSGLTMYYLCEPDKS
jgi:hypothetical protein